MGISCEKWGNGLLYNDTTLYISCKNDATMCCLPRFTFGIAAHSINSADSLRSPATKRFWHNGSWAIFRLLRLHRVGNKTLNICFLKESWVVTKHLYLCIQYTLSTLTLTQSSDFSPICPYHFCVEFHHRILRNVNMCYIPRFQVF